MLSPHYSLILPPSSPLIICTFPVCSLSLSILRHHLQFSSVFSLAYLQFNGTELASCKILQSHPSIVFSEAHLNWFLTVIAEIVRGLENRFFLKFGELDRGRMKLSKLRSVSGWVLCCDFWPALDGRSTIWDFLGDDKKGWLSFLLMLERFLSNLKYKKWCFEPSSSISRSFTASKFLFR